MTTLNRDDADTRRVLRSQDDVEERIRAICFKTGPPEQIGAELEWTLHHQAAPEAPLRAATVREALGPHAPQTLAPGSPQLPLPAGGTVTLEPGGQTELSSAPATSLSELHAAVSADLAHLEGLLSGSGLTLGGHGIDPRREPRRLLHTPRYDAMERFFEPRGPHGRTMMCSTAGLQVCVDVGREEDLTTRWAAVWALGPALLAAFATSRRHAGRDTGWASARMAAWLGMDPRLTHPVRAPANDPAAGWLAYAMDAPVVVVRRDSGDWSAPRGLTLRDWIGGALTPRPTVEDLDYHLTMLFPPVRPRGYLEVRYLDAQPGEDWIVPVAVVAALLSGPGVTDRALDLALPAADRWEEASRRGLADPLVRRAAADVLELACRQLDEGLPGAVRNRIIDTVQRRLHDAATHAAEEQ
jgi:glutamate--cysteine ligase